MSAAFGTCFDPTGARYGIPTYPDPTPKGV